MKRRATPLRQEPSPNRCTAKPWTYPVRMRLCAAGVEQMEQKRSYYPRPAAYLYNVPSPPMIIDGIVPAGAVVGLSGQPGTGKSWLSLEMSRALATGTSFLGKFPVRPTPVVFVGS